MRTDSFDCAASTGLSACYAFGSRGTDAVRLLAGEIVERDGSDLDIGVAFKDDSLAPQTLAALQVGLEDLFAPLRVDVVPLDQSLLRRGIEALLDTARHLLARRFGLATLEYRECGVAACPGRSKPGRAGGEEPPERLLGQAPAQG